MKGFDIWHAQWGGEGLGPERPIMDANHTFGEQGLLMRSMICGQIRDLATILLAPFLLNAAQSIGLMGPFH